MDRLAARVQHARDGILREPVDLQIRMQRAQLARDGDVAQRVPEADRARDEQRALGPSQGAPPRGTGRRAEKVAHGQVEADRMTRLRAMAGGLERFGGNWVSNSYSMLTRSPRLIFPPRTTPA